MLVAGLQALEQGLGLGFVVFFHPVRVQAHGELAVELLHLRLGCSVQGRGGGGFGVLVLGVAIKLCLRIVRLGARLVAAGLRMQRLQVLALGVQAIAQQGADGRVLGLVKGVDGAVHVGQIGL